jgi:zinc transport system ATP-binding protein
VLLECRKLSVGYRSPLLPVIDVSLGRGEVWAVVGRNGSGKSTWLRTILGLQPALGGEVWRRPELKFTYLAQRQSYDDHYPLRARDVVRMGLDRGLSFLSPMRRDAEARERRALALVNGSDLRDRPFRQLSEGQKQRVLLARVAIAEPDLAVLDEPTSAMDLVAEHDAFELIVKLRDELAMGIVVITHDLGLARKFADRVLLFDRDQGEVVVGAPAVVLEHGTLRPGSVADRGASST